MWSSVRCRLQPVAMVLLFLTITIFFNFTCELNVYSLFTFMSKTCSVYIKPLPVTIIINVSVLLECIKECINK